MITAGKTLWVPTVKPGVNQTPKTTGMLSVNKSVLCSNIILFATKIRVLVALVSSLFLYNWELWSLSQADNRKTDAFQCSFLRQIIRNRCNNQLYKLYKACHLEPWSVGIRKETPPVVRLSPSAARQRHAKCALAEARQSYKKNPRPPAYQHHFQKKKVNTWPPKLRHSTRATSKPSGTSPEWGHSKFGLKRAQRTWRVCELTCGARLGGLR